MRIYVAGALADSARVRDVQAAVVAAGHELTLDWTSGEDVSLRDYASEPEAAGRIAAADLDAVRQADAVLVVTSEHQGRGMFVELGAALAEAESGRMQHVVVLGGRPHDSAFFYHPAVQRFLDVEEWLSSLP